MAVAEIRINAAGQLIGRREYAYAEALPAPLAVDPHHESMAAAARQLIELARAGAANAANPAEPEAAAAE